MQVSDVVFGNRAFSSDVTAVMLVYQYKRMLNLILSKVHQHGRRSTFQFLFLSGTG